MELRQFWRIGITGVDRAVASGLDYEAALKLCKNDLRFLGIGAAKLTALQEFEQAVIRCSREHRPVKLLLCHPLSPSLKDAAKRAGKPEDEFQHILEESLNKIKDLNRRRSINIEVRLYKTNVPLFRLMFIDNSLCLSSYYVMGEGDGSQLPQLHVTLPHGRSAKESLYFAFEQYFDQLWEKSKPWTWGNWPK